MGPKVRKELDQWDNHHRTCRYGCSTDDDKRDFGTEDIRIRYPVNSEPGREVHCGIDTTVQIFQTPSLNQDMEIQCQIHLPPQLERATVIVIASVVNLESMAQSRHTEFCIHLCLSTGDGHLHRDGRTGNSVFHRLTVGSLN